MNESDLYYDHNGRGPGVARVTSISDGKVYLQRKTSAKSKNWRAFSLTVQAFNSQSCGWKRRNVKQE